MYFEKKITFHLSLEPFLFIVAGCRKKVRFTVISMESKQNFYKSLTKKGFFQCFDNFFALLIPVTFLLGNCFELFATIRHR